MTDQPKRSRWKRRALWAFVLLLPVQYVASVGPAYGLYWRGYVDYPTIKGVYKPVFWATGFLSKPITTAFDRYLNLFFP